MLELQIFCHIFYKSTYKSQCEIFRLQHLTWQRNWTVLCQFLDCSNFCPMGTVYYFTGHPVKTISSYSLKFILVFKWLHCYFYNILNLWTPKANLGGLTIRQKRIWDIRRLSFWKPTHSIANRKWLQKAVVSLKKIYPNGSINILVMSPPHD